MTTSHTPADGILLLDILRRLKCSAEDRTFIAALLLHCADISNPTRPKEIQDAWAKCVLREFFAQVRFIASRKELASSAPSIPATVDFCLNISAAQCR